MKEKQTDKGILKYRMPNVLEVFDLLDQSGVSQGLTDTLKIKRNILANISNLIDLSGLEGVNSYEDLLNDIDSFTAPLSQIADELIEKLFDVFKKKTA